MRWLITLQSQIEEELHEKNPIYVNTNTKRALLAIGYRQSEGTLDKYFVSLETLKEQGVKLSSEEEMALNGDLSGLKLLQLSEENENNIEEQPAIMSNGAEEQSRRK